MITRPLALMTLSATGLLACPALAQEAGEICPPTVAAASDAERTFTGALALSNDGAVVVAGAREADGPAFYTWRRAGNDAWRGIGRLTATSADLPDVWRAAGPPFAVDGSGATLAVAEPGERADDGSGGAGVAVYRSAGDDGGWRLTNRLTAADFAYDLDFDSAGQLTVVTAGEEADSVVVQQFTPGAEGFTAGPPLTLVGQAFRGLAVDNDLVALGRGGEGGGEVLLLSNDGGRWRSLARLTASDTISPDYFGAAVAAGGGTVIVGETRDQAAYAYAPGGDDGGWRQVARLTAADTFRGRPGEEWAFASLLTARDALLAPADEGGDRLEQVGIARDAIRQVIDSGEVGFWFTDELIAAARRLDGALARPDDREWVQAQILTSADLVRRSVSNGGGTLDFGRAVDVNDDGSVLLIGAKGAGGSFQYTWQRGARGSYDPGVVLTIRGGNFGAAVARPTGAFDSGTTIAGAAPESGLLIYERAELCEAPVDTDADGIEDASDACPEVAAGPYDFDGDGCPDGRDAIADALAGQITDAFAALGDQVGHRLLAAVRLRIAEQTMLGPNGRGGALNAFRRGQLLAGVNRTGAALGLVDVRGVDPSALQATLFAAEQTFVALELGALLADGADAPLLAAAGDELSAAGQQAEAGAFFEAHRLLRRAVLLMERHARQARQP